MTAPLLQALGTFSRGKTTASGGTPFAVLVPPYANKGSNLGTAAKGEGIARITQLIYDIGTTAHTLSILRPLNYTTFSAPAASGQAVVSLTADPGVYSTAYKYPLPNGQTGPRAADDAIASGDYVVYQAADGTYLMDTAAGSYSSGSLTLTTNLPTGGVLQGGLFWYFGVAGDVEPSTGFTQEQIDIPAATSGVVRNTLTDPSCLWDARHPGDPLILYSPNTTAAGIAQLVSGYYARN